MSDGGARGGRATARIVLNWVLVYGSWTVLSAAAVAVVFAVRDTLRMAHVALDLGKWSAGLTDKWSLYILGVAALIWVLYLQYYLAQGYPGGTSLGTFPRRLVRGVLITAAVLVPALAIRLFL